VTQEQLFAEYAVGCIFCPHTVRRTDPGDAHDAMEEHYQDEHRADIDALLGVIR
jgi:hypothetical protein